jgi:CHASE1-domain containing sensor protein
MREISAFEKLMETINDSTGEYEGKVISGWHRTLATLFQPLTEFVAPYHPQRIIFDAGFNLCITLFVFVFVFILTENLP